MERYTNYGKKSYKKKINKQKVVSNITEGEVIQALLDRKNLEGAIEYSFYTRVVQNKKKLGKTKIKDIGEKLNQNVMFLFVPPEDELLAFSDNNSTESPDRIKSVYIKDFDSRISEQGAKLKELNSKLQQKNNNNLKEQFKAIKYGTITKSKKQS